MNAYLLKHNMQTGIPSLEVYLSPDHLIAANAQHAGVVIKTKADLTQYRQRYKGQGWVIALLDKIDPKTLED